MKEYVLSITKGVISKSGWHRQSSNAGNQCNEHIHKKLQHMQHYFINTSVVLVVQKKTHVHWSADIITLCCLSNGRELVPDLSQPVQHGFQSLSTEFYIYTTNHGHFFFIVSRILDLGEERIRQGSKGQNGVTVILFPIFFTDMANAILPSSAPSM